IKEERVLDGLFGGLVVDLFGRVGLHGGAQGEREAILRVRAPSRISGQVTLTFGYVVKNPNQLCWACRCVGVADSRQRVPKAEAEARLAHVEGPEPCRYLHGQLVALEVDEE